MLDEIKAKRCEYCNSYNISLDSSTGKIICNNSECIHKNEKQKGKNEDFTKKVNDIHEKEVNALNKAVMNGNIIDLSNNEN